MTFKQLRAAAPLVFTTLFGLFLSLMPLPASAATPAVAVASVNMRAGPSVRYPVVVTLPSRAALEVYGCVADSSWCDISWGPSRGWVAANYVQVFYRGASVVVTPAIAPVVGISIIAFNQAYWNAHYVGRPWYGEYNAYYRPGLYGAPDPYPAGRAVAGHCGNGYCSGASVTAGPYGGGRAAVGSCGNGSCSGASAIRGPGGNVIFRRGTISRD